jgi:hypothetical protein
MKSHPTLTRYREAARRLGCRATTADGIRRWTRDNTVSKTIRLHYSKPMQRWTWEDQQRTRKADPEAKRAKHDKAFRRRYLARLTRTENKLCKCDGTLSGIADYYLPQTESERILTLQEIARQRKIVTGKDSPVRAPTQYGIRIPVDAVNARKHGCTISMRGDNARVIACREPSHHDHEPGITKWKGGRPIKYTRAKNDNYVRSVAVVRDSLTLDYMLHNDTYAVTLPEGYHWHLDYLGLRAVSDADRSHDYHVCAADLLAQVENPERIPAMIRENAETRQRVKAEQAAEAAALAGIYVCVADSINAGNCRAGTIAFAKRHKLDVRRHYPAPELLAQANGEAGRVRLAITAARRRHGREMERGYCDLPQATH